MAPEKEIKLVKSLIGSSSERLSDRSLNLLFPQRFSSPLSFEKHALIASLITDLSIRRMKRFMIHLCCFLAYRLVTIFRSSIPCFNSCSPCDKSNSVSPFLFRGYLNFFGQTKDVFFSHFHFKPDLLCHWLFPEMRSFEERKKMAFLVQNRI